MIYVALLVVYGVGFVLCWWWFGEDGWAPGLLWPLLALTFLLLIPGSFLHTDRPWRCRLGLHDMDGMKMHYVGPAGYEESRCAGCPHTFRHNVY